VDRATRIRDVRVRAARREGEGVAEGGTRDPSLHCGCVDVRGEGERGTKDNAMQSIYLYV
jgi:hypothetical protein